MEDGYEFFGGARDMLTIFSAPDYCSQFDNKAAVLIVDKALKCSFKLLMPLKKLVLDSPQIKKFLKECNEFEDLFPLQKNNIK